MLSPLLVSAAGVALQPVIPAPPGYFPGAPCLQPVLQLHHSLDLLQCLLGVGRDQGQGRPSGQGGLGFAQRNS